MTPSSSFDILHDEFVRSERRILDAIALVSAEMRDVSAAIGDLRERTLVVEQRLNTVERAAAWATGLVVATITLTLGTLAFFAKWAKSLSLS